LTYPAAKLAYLTSPERGVVILNTQIDGAELQRVTLNRDQLLNLNKQAVDIVVGLMK